MINKKLPMDILKEIQSFSQKGLISKEERVKISDACKSYARTGDDDEFYEFLSWASENLSDVVKKFFELKKEEIYERDNNSCNS